MVSAEMLDCKLLSTQAIYTLHDMIEITNDQPRQKSSQNSVFLRATECHCQVAEFLLHKCKRIIKSNFRASNTLLNIAEYAITMKDNLVSLHKHLAR